MKVGCERGWKDVSVVKSTRLPVGGDGLIISPPSGRRV